MGIAELLILVVFLSIVALILRLLVSALRTRKNRIKIALDKNIPEYDLDELELRELPNGGARMVQRSFEEVMRQASELESLDAAKKRPRSKVLKTDLTREAVLARRAAAMAAAEAAVARGEVLSEPDLFTGASPEGSSESQAEENESVGAEFAHESWGESGSVAYASAATLAESNESAESFSAGSVEQEDSSYGFSDGDSDIDAETFAYADPLLSAESVESAETAIFSEQVADPEWVLEQPVAEDVTYVADADEQPDVTYAAEICDSADASCTTETGYAEDEQSYMAPPGWAAAAVHADEYKSTLGQDEVSLTDYSDNDWLEDVSPALEAQVTRPAAQAPAAPVSRSSGYQERAEPVFTMMRFDDELGLVPHDEPEPSGTNPDVSMSDDHEPETYESGFNELNFHEPRFNETETDLRELDFVDSDEGDEDDEDDELDDEETADYFLDSAVDVDDDQFDVGFGAEADPAHDPMDPEPQDQDPDMLESQFRHQDPVEPVVLRESREPREPREPEEIDDVLDELLLERGVSTEVDYSRVNIQESEYRPSYEPELPYESDPDDLPVEVPGELPPEMPDDVPEEMPVSEPVPVSEPEPEYQPPFSPQPEPEPEYQPSYQPEPEDVPDELPEELPGDMPEEEPVPSETPEDVPVPVTEPEIDPDPAPIEIPNPEEPVIEPDDDEEEPLPEFEAELEVEPEPQPQPVDSFAAVENKDDIDDLFKDEDQQRRLEAREQEQESTPKRLMGWAGATFGKLTTSIAESRARAAEERERAAEVKAARDEAARERAAEQKAARDEAARERAEALALQKQQQELEKARQREKERERQDYQREQAELARQAQENARRHDENSLTDPDYDDPLSDYSTDDSPMLSDEYQEEFAARRHDEDGIDDQTFNEQIYDERDSEPEYEAEEYVAPEAARKPVDRNLERYGESPYKQHQFGYAPASEAAATAASATAAASAAKTQPKTRAQSRNLRENQLSLDMPAEDDFSDSGFSEVLVINVMARPNSSIQGDELLPAVLGAGLRFGDMSIFHRHADRRGGPVLFSMANALNPGTFDLNEISHFTTQGVTFFMTLPNVANNMLAFEQMLATARHVQSVLDADLKDDNRSVMTAQTVEHYRQRIRDFELQQLKNSRQK